MTPNQTPKFTKKDWRLAYSPKQLAALSPREIEYLELKFAVDCGINFLDEMELGIARMVATYSAMYEALEIALKELGGLDKADINFYSPECELIRKALKLARGEN